MKLLESIEQSHACKSYRAKHDEHTHEPITNYLLMIQKQDNTQVGVNTNTAETMPGVHLFF